MIFVIWLKESRRGLEPASVLLAFFLGKQNESRTGKARLQPSDQAGDQPSWDPGAVSPVCRRSRISPYHAWSSFGIKNHRIDGTPE